MKVKAGVCFFQCFSSVFFLQINAGGGGGGGRGGANNTQSAKKKKLLEYAILDNNTHTSHLQYRAHHALCCLPPQRVHALSSKDKGLTHSHCFPISVLGINRHVVACGACSFAVAKTWNSAGPIYPTLPLSCFYALLLPHAHVSLVIPSRFHVEFMYID